MVLFSHYVGRSVLRFIHTWSQQLYFSYRYKFTRNVEKLHGIFRKRANKKAFCREPATRLPA